MNGQRQTGLHGSPGSWTPSMSACPPAPGPSGDASPEPAGGPGWHQRCRSAEGLLLRHPALFSRLKASAPHPSCHARPAASQTSGPRVDTGFSSLLTSLIKATGYEIHDPQWGQHRGHPHWEPIVLDRLRALKAALLDQTVSGGPGGRGAGAPAARLAQTLDCTPEDEGVFSGMESRFVEKSKKRAGVQSLASASCLSVQKRKGMQWRPDPCQDSLSQSQLPANSDE
ncbi:unnamed protein product [Boreogadus saida]